MLKRAIHATEQGVLVAPIAGAKTARNAMRKGSIRAATATEPVRKETKNENHLEKSNHKQSP